MAGYSDTPLVKKIGIKEGFRFAVVNAPDGFDATLGALPASVRQLARARAPMDCIIFFSRRAAEVVAKFPRLAELLAPAGMLWVAWPKKSSNVPTDVDFTVVQTTGLGTGLVDVKVCAIDDVWSGLKFVRRLADR